MDKKYEREIGMNRVVETVNVFGRFYEELEVKRVYIHSVRKTITESDNNLFCLLTMNHHPVHLDEIYAREQKYRRILVVGTYVLSLVVGLSVADISGKAIANLGYESVVHNKPVFVGDTLCAETVVLDKKVTAKDKNKGIVYVETRAFNDREERVLTLRRRILIPMRGADEKK